MSQQPGLPTLEAPAEAPARDGEGERLRRRRRLLGWSSPVMLLALMAAALLLGVSLGNYIARADVERDAPAAAAERFEDQKRWTPVLIEPWKAWYNTGTAYLIAGEAFLASDELRVALEKVPPAPAKESGALDPASAECHVRTNLSLALEALGDSARADGDPAMARAYYDEGLGILAPCTSDGQPPPEDRSQEPPPQSPQDEQEQRQQDKSEEAQEEAERGQNPDGGQDGDGGSPEEGPEGEQGQEGQEGQGGQQGEDGQNGDDGAPQDGEGQQDEGQGEESDGSTGDPRLDELLDRNREAEQDRQEEQQRRGGGSSGGQNW